MTSPFFDYPTEPALTPPIDLAFWPQRSQRDWRKLLDVMQTLRFRPNEVALKAGAVPDGFYVVGFGRFIANNSTIPEGNAIGINAFFAQQPIAHAITATTDGELLYLSRAAFDAFAAREPELARDMLFELGRIIASRSAIVFRCSVIGIR